MMLDLGSAEASTAMDDTPAPERWAALRRRMEEAGHNPRSLSLAAGMNHTAMRDIFEGRAKSPHYSTLESIAGVLGCTVADIAPTETIPPAAVWLRKALKQRGATQADLAKALKQTQPHVSRLLSGERIPQADEIGPLAAFFGASGHFMLDLFGLGTAAAPDTPLAQLPAPSADWIPVMVPRPSRGQVTTVTVNHEGTVTIKQEKR